MENYVNFEKSFRWGFSSLVAINKLARLEIERELIELIILAFKWSLKFHDKPWTDAESALLNFLAKLIKTSGFSLRNFQVQRLENNIASCALWHLSTVMVSRHLKVSSVNSDSPNEHVSLETEMLFFGYKLCGSLFYGAKCDEISSTPEENSRLMFFVTCWWTPFFWFSVDFNVIWMEDFWHASARLKAFQKDFLEPTRW